ncbi:MAG TPA: hypothetical protein VFD69_06550 [Vicinamibacterales bacterium]|nr:hypothetical protein [Vicinamibacterales bacterium]
MISRLALRSLTAHPVRSAVLSVGFGAGVAVMAILLGVAEIVLQQAQSPDLVGGGDVVIRVGRQIPASLLLSGTLQAEALRSRIVTTAPTQTADLYLTSGGKRIRVAGRGGVPSLERALGDHETSAIGAWQDTEADRAWTHSSPAAALREIDKFHPVPDAPAWADSWAEWLYFNGRGADARFYLTFLVGPRAPDGRRAAGVRLQLQRGDRTENYNASALLTDAEVAGAPDLAIGASTVRLDGQRYRLHLDLVGPDGTRAVGDVSLEGSPGRLVPPIEMLGAKGWRTGYVVPVMSGALAGSLTLTPRGAATPETLSLDGTGYHDHNWGFWKGVSWQWGQAQHEGVSVVYGRVFPPEDAADRERLPGFVGVLGPDGPLGFATNVQIAETNAPDGRPTAITVRALGSALDITLRFDVTSAVTTRMAQGPLANDVNFLQLQGRYTVSGRAAGRTLEFTAPGAAETFRGAP